MNTDGAADVLEAFLNGLPPYDHDRTEIQAREAFARVWKELNTELLTPLEPFSQGLIPAVNKLFSTLNVPGGEQLLFPAMNALAVDVANGMIGYTATPPPLITPANIISGTGDNAADAAITAAGLTAWYSLGTAQQIGSPNVQSWK